MIQSVWRKQFKLTRDIMPPPPGSQDNNPPKPPITRQSSGGFSNIASLLVRPGSASLLFGGGGSGNGGITAQSAANSVQAQAKVISEVTQRFARNFASTVTGGSVGGKIKSTVSISSVTSKVSDRDTPKDANTNPTAKEADGLMIVEPIISQPPNSAAAEALSNKPPAVETQESYDEEVGESIPLTSIRESLSLSRKQSVKRRDSDVEGR